MNKEKLTEAMPEAALPQRKRTPVASADGSTSARLHDQQVGRRRRVRVITTDNEIVVPQRRLTTRFDKPSMQEGREGYREPVAGQSRERENHRNEYHERYQEAREKGNYNSYDYNELRKANNKSQGKGNNPNGKNRKSNNQSNHKKGKGVHTGKGFGKGLVDVQQEVPEAVVYPNNFSPETLIRLNKYIANSGVPTPEGKICSRREADKLIASGQITVNGEVVTELGRRITPQDEVCYNGQRVENLHKVYILLNKPKNCITTKDDPQNRKTVMDLIAKAEYAESVYPVGRLDRNTTGVLLLTNDGELAAKLTHPSYGKKKIYHVWLDREVEQEHMQAIADGFSLEDGEENGEKKYLEIYADALSYVTEDDLSQVGIEIHSGQNRIVRRIFEHFGYKVKKLDRVYFAGLTKRNLKRGQWRYLDQNEVNNLRMGAFE